MSKAVLDASAILALLHGEPGQDKVASVITDATVSAVNLAEVVGKLVERGGSEAAIRLALGKFSLPIVAFDDAQAYRAGLLKAQGRGLSLGDRACLALAISMDLPAYTADRTWARLKTGARVVVIR
ncbi:MAG: type II toxin-antitoxin system VapC family toxin [Chloroflexi bacterium]|nr:type II toxin-antitoxin system VapC family toxin [Chloroflexota bacterium]